ncbi:hypothetical protein [Phytohabitans suffuscus]|uniref:hypothetical protein n=1 Tax=Phytohabitans suffuscus TaxID=624315 RepID=UPI001563DA42|nr:hypothetical protein [Phytohabitans suffuscus]
MGVPRHPRHRPAPGLGGRRSGHGSGRRRLDHRAAAPDATSGCSRSGFGGLAGSGCFGSGSGCYGLVGSCSGCFGFGLGLVGFGWFAAGLVYAA